MELRHARKKLVGVIQRSAAEKLNFHLGSLGRVTGLRRERMLDDMHRSELSVLTELAIRKEILPFRDDSLGRFARCDESHFLITRWAFRVAVATAGFANGPVHVKSLRFGVLAIDTWGHCWPALIKQNTIRANEVMAKAALKQEIADAP
jgi:hypothetical protein